MHLHQIVFLIILHTSLADELQELPDPPQECSNLNFAQFQKEAVSCCERLCYDKFKVEEILEPQFYQKGHQLEGNRTFDKDAMIMACFDPSGRTCAYVSYDDKNVIKVYDGDGSERFGSARSFHEVAYECIFSSIIVELLLQLLMVN